MDALKACRRQHRRLFTKACNEFDVDENNLSPSDKVTKLKMIEEKAKLMIDVEERIREMLFSENVEDVKIDNDIDESEVYIDRWRILQQKLTQLLVSENEDSVSNASVTKQNALLHYPKIQLPTFNGEIKNWLQFWGQFQKIDKDPNLDLHDKFAYLSQAMEQGSVAEELIRSFPPGGNSYTKAVNQLKSRFGREELLIEHYVRDLLGLVLQKQNPDKHNSLRRLYDSLESKLRALETLGVVRDKYAAMLYPLVESSLPDDTLRAWQRHRLSHRRSSDRCVDMESKLDKHLDKTDVETGSKTDLDNLLEFLQDEVETEERISLASKSFDKTVRHKAARNKHEYENSQISTASDLLNSDKKKRATDKINFNQELCIFCDKQHASEKCFKAISMPYDAKKDIILKKGACFLCLKGNHIARNCRTKIRCIICRKNHETIVCSKATEKISRPEIPKTDSLGKEDNVLASQASNQNGAVLLQTLVVRLKNQNKGINVRAIIDTGSERTYITEDVVKTLGYGSTNEVKLIHKLFGGVETKQKLHHQYKVKVASIDNNYECQLMCLDENVICSNIRKVPNGPWMDELRQHGIKISDSEDNVLNVAPEIKLLIGSDVAGKLMTGRQKILSNGLVAMETLLGWCLMGKIPEDMNHESVAMTVTSLLLENLKIEDLWNLDIIGITDPVSQQSKEEKDLKTKTDFFNSVKINEEGRYEISLPWKEEHLPLPSNKNLAQRRLEKTTSKLNEENLYQTYDNIFNEWQSLGIIEEINQSDPIDYGHYLPHRPVIKENSSTPVRPVFDASARTKFSPSLNQSLECGPNLIELIPAILLRFREGKFAAIADIEKAFLQISVRPEDRDYLRFLWWNCEGENNLKIFRHTRVVFGVTSSPFLLAAVIEFHLSKFMVDSHYDTQMLCKLLRSFYVDNVVTSFENKFEMMHFIEESKRIMNAGKFNLRGWLCTGDNSEIEVPVLGLLWNSKKDHLRINLNWLKSFKLSEITKRNILAVTHKVYDPIGFLSPVLILPKMMLQSLWKTGISWDTEVDEKTKDKFINWYRELFLLKEISVPRWIHADRNGEKSCSIHTFCDASSKSYAAAVFVRIQTSSTIEVHLLASKSRVAPVKSVTIPRLELIAAVVGARLCTSVLEGLQWQNVELYFWTDSTTVLTWIQKEEIWTVFVANRVREIRKLTDLNSWRHIPGTENPADLPSRGCSAKQLLAVRWWEGPGWLKKSESEWPISNLVYNQEDITQEIRKTVVTATHVNTETEELFQKISSFVKLIRLIAWIYRFYFNMKGKNTRCVGNLTSKEISRAERVVLKTVQQEAFPNGINEQKIKSLHPKLDERGLMRVETRIFRRKDKKNFRLPIILPSKNRIVHMLIASKHEELGHPGVQILMNHLRENYWILQSRKTVRQVISQCIRCKRFTVTHPDPRTTCLPEDRVRDATIFEISGIDLGGPLYLKDGTKAWIVLFTCAVYRAVHMELITSLTSEAFLQSLRRFIARRGRPKIIYSDNGSNFVKAHSDLSKLDWKKIESQTTLKQITWKFIPPSAPWYGGWWERMIGMTKQILRKVLGQALLNYEELNTVLCDTESLINSRPLTYLSEDINDLIALSPSMFLHETKECGVPDIDKVDSTFMRKRYLYVQKVREDLRRRFRLEYLGQLQHSKRAEVSKPISVGEIVLIGSDNLKRLQWPIGRIVELLPGKDGIVRVVKVKTKTGIITRPVQRIYPLEVSNESEGPFLRSKVPVCANKKDLKDGTFPDDPSTKPKIVVTRGGRTVKSVQRLDL